MTWGGREGGMERGRWDQQPPPSFFSDTVVKNIISGKTFPSEGRERRPCHPPHRICYHSLAISTRRFVFQTASFPQRLPPSRILEMPPPPPPPDAVVLSIPQTAAFVPSLLVVGNSRGWERFQGRHRLGSSSQGVMKWWFWVS